MKYTKPRTIWECALCEAACNVLHEICFGTGNRKIAVEYSVQAPICPNCHILCHKHKEEYQEKLFDWLGLDMYVTIRAFNNYRLRGYLEINKEHCENRIKGQEL